MTKQEPSMGYKAAVVLSGVIAAGVIFMLVTYSSTTEVVNVQPVADSAETVSEEDKAIDEIKSRPDIQQKFDNYAKEVYLTEVREKKAQELEAAEAQLDQHRTEHQSF